MNSDQNIATRRLLQVVLDMLTNPDFEQLMAEREQQIAKGEHVYNPPSRYRCELIAVEAAHRAATRYDRHPPPEDPSTPCSDGVTQVGAFPWRNTPSLPPPSASAGQNAPIGLQLGHR